MRGRRLAGSRDKGQERLEGRRNLEEGDTYVAGKTWSLERLGGRRDLETGATWR